MNEATDLVTSGYARPMEHPEPLANADDPALAGALRQLAGLRLAPTDAMRPDAVARQRARDARTARERIDSLVYPGSFLEYGLLARPSQPGRVNGRRPFREKRSAMKTYLIVLVSGVVGAAASVAVALAAARTGEVGVWVLAILVVPVVVMLGGCWVAARWDPAFDDQNNRLLRGKHRVYQLHLVAR